MDLLLHLIVQVLHRVHVHTRRECLRFSYRFAEQKHYKLNQAQLKVKVAIFVKGTSTPRLLHP